MGRLISTKAESARWVRLISTKAASEPLPDESHKITKAKAASETLPGGALNINKGSELHLEQGHKDVSKDLAHEREHIINAWKVSKGSKC